MKWKNVFPHFWFTWLSYDISPQIYVSGKFNLQWPKIFISQKGQPQTPRTTFGLCLWAVSWKLSPKEMELAEMQRVRIFPRAWLCGSVSVYPVHWITLRLEGEFLPSAAWAFIWLSHRPKSLFALEQQSVKITHCIKIFSCRCSLLPAFELNAGAS